MVDCSSSKQRNVNVVNQLQYSYTSLCAIILCSFLATSSRLPEHVGISGGTCRPTRVVDHYSVFFARLLIKISSVSNCRSTDACERLFSFAPSLPETTE